MAESGLPLVSVVVPAFRHERFVECCLESIAAQTYPNLELVLVDDRSPDATFALAQEFAALHEKRFARIAMRRNTANRGAHFSLNRGVELSRGDYVSFMNSDDTYAPERIATMIDALRSADLQFAFSRVGTVDEQDRPYFDEPLCHHVHWQAAVRAGRLPSLSWAFIQFQIAASTGNMLVRRDLCRKIGPFAPLLYCHDWDYIVRATFYTEPVYVPEPLYNYRIHGANSFKGLSREIGMSDSAYVLRNHFRRVMTSCPPNRLAAAPQHWPTLFEPLLASMGRLDFYLEQYRPYRPHFRTVDKSLAAAAH